MEEMDAAQAAYREAARWTPGQVLTAGKGEDGAELTTYDVLEEIAAERRRQREECGYSDRDDDRWEPSSWAAFIHNRVERGFARRRAQPLEPTVDYRQRLIEAAALCVAAVEAYDRRQEER